MPAVPIVDYSPNNQGGFYIFNSLHASGLLGHAGLVPGDTCIGWDQVTPMPSPASRSQFTDIGYPAWFAPVPPAVWMVPGDGSMYFRGWFEIPAACNLAVDWFGGQMMSASNIDHSGHGGRLFEIDVSYRPQFTDPSTGLPAGGFTIELERSPWSPPDNVNFEQCLSAQTSNFYVSGGTFEEVQGPTIGPGKHEIVVSYDQTTRLATFWLDGTQIGLPRQPGPASADFSAGNPGGQPYGHVAGAADGSFVTTPQDITGIEMGTFAVVTHSFGHDNYTFAAHDEFDFGPHALSPTDVATTWALRNSWAARTAAVLAQTPYGAFHLNEYPYTPPPPVVGGWHVGAIGWGS